MVRQSQTDTYASRDLAFEILAAYGATMQRGLWKLQPDYRALEEGKATRVPKCWNWNLRTFSFQRQILARYKECFHQHSTPEFDRWNCPKPACDLCSNNKKASKAENSNSNQRAPRLLWHLHDQARTRRPRSRSLMRPNSAQHIREALFFSGHKGFETTNVECLGRNARI